MGLQGCSSHSGLLTWKPEPEAHAFDTGDRSGLAPFKEDWKPGILWVRVPLQFAFKRGIERGQDLVPSSRMWSLKPGSSFEA